MRASTRDGKDGRAERTLWRALVVGAVLMGSVCPAEATLTTPACLAKKLNEWGSLRKCQATDGARRLQAKPAQPDGCQTRFAAKLTALSARAKAAGIPCRYEVNGDGTVTDYDTGLQW